MTQTCSANRVAGGRAEARRRSRWLALLSVAAGLLGGPLAGPAAAAVPTPTNLRVVAGVESLHVRWGMTSIEGLAGFRLRWRPVSGSLPWSTPVERAASSRGYTITGLTASEPYEARVRAILSGGVLGGSATAIGTPLAPTLEEGEEPSEEGEEGAVVPPAPIGPPAPASGWHIIYADAFGARLGSGPGQDNTLRSGEKAGGCCNNSNEIAVEQHSQARVGPGGLELVCSEGSFTVEGVTRKYSCGGVRGDAFVEWNYATSGEWVAECVCRWPADSGSADPGFWVYSGAQEIDFFEGWGWNGTSWLTADAGMPVVVGQKEFELGLVVGVLGFDPSAAYHRYTTAFIPLGGSSFHVVQYIDGVKRWAFDANLANTSDGPILTNALRRPTLLGHPAADVMSVRSIAIYQDAAHAGQGVTGGGVAPGTTVAP